MNDHTRWRAAQTTGWRAYNRYKAENVPEHELVAGAIAAALIEASRKPTRQTVLKVLPHDPWCRSNPNGEHAACCGPDALEHCGCVAQDSLDALVTAGLLEVTR